MKSIIGKFAVQSDSFRKICTITNEEVTDKMSIDEKLNSFKPVQISQLKHPIAQPIHKHIFQKLLLYFNKTF